MRKLTNSETHSCIHSLASFETCEQSPKQADEDDANLFEGDGMLVRTFPSLGMAFLITLDMLLIGTNRSFGTRNRNMQ